MPAKNFHVRQAAVSALRAWAKGHDYAETLIERHAHRRMLSSADRGLLQAILFGVLRNRRLLDHWIGILRQGKLDPETRDVLRVGLCQTLILGLPDHAAVNETVEAGKASVRGLVNAVLRRSITSRKRLLDEVPDLAHARRPLAPGLAFQPLEGGLRQTPGHLAHGVEQPASRHLFPRQPARPSSRRQLPGNPVEDAPGFYQLDGPLPGALLAAGSIYIQDPATRHAVDLLDPQPGERILDACAAPGGKAFLIAAALGSAENLCLHRLQRKTPAAPSGKPPTPACRAATVAVHDWTKPAPAEWHAAFDGILLDVPCSNTGVIRRRVDVRWRLQAPDIDKIAVTQRKILENALPCLKPGGRLVYSTCSIEPEENLGQIEAFLADHPDLRLHSTREALPFRDHTDGAFAARIQH